MFNNTIIIQNIFQIKEINNIKQNEKENNLNNYDLYDLVKFDETLINKGYFYENI